MLTPEEFADRIRAIFQDVDHDVERAHGEADELLCDLLRELGYGDGVTIFENASKWYS